MNSAFYIGSVEIIRLLLSAGADLEYKNFRPWTAPSFLWDPDRTTPEDTDEILDICMEKGYTAWNDTDEEGWTPCHRAAAYGRGQDIRNLNHKGGNMLMYSTNEGWGPITCAVRYANKDTFDALLKILRAEDVVDFRDYRGWSLLHFAAQGGCEAIVETLLDLGAEPGIVTEPTYYWVIESLEYKALTAEVIAREYGHKKICERLAGLK